MVTVGDYARWPRRACARRRALAQTIDKRFGRRTLPGRNARALGRRIAYCRWTADGCDEAEWE